MNGQRLAFGAIFLLLASFFGTFLLREDAVRREGAPEQVREEEPAVAAVPARIRIPSLNIDAPVLAVGLTPDGGMDIPDSVTDVGWFEPGFRPGMAGNAVMTGHLDSVIGTPGVFADLHLLKSGDVIEVDDAERNTRRFEVKNIATYSYNSAPMERIFGSATGAHLNLITCHGTWNRATYTKRLVVFTDLMNERKLE